MKTNVLLHLSLVCLAIGLSACGRDKALTGDKELVSLVEVYNGYAREFAGEQLLDLEIKFVDGFSDSRKLAECIKPADEDDQSKINVSKAKFYALPQIQQEFLVYHEATHCLKAGGRGHLDTLNPAGVPVSAMNSVLIGSSILKTNDRYYITELVTAKANPSAVRMALFLPPEGFINLDPSYARDAGVILAPPRIITPRTMAWFSPFGPDVDNSTSCGESKVISGLRSFESMAKTLGFQLFHNCS